MDVRQLRNVLAVIEKRNLSKAAQSLNISQPALTKSIQRLEANLGVDLFERTPTGMQPTIYGQCLSAHALSLTVGVSQAVAEIKAMKAGAVGLVTVAVPPLIASEIMPDAITRMAREQPKVNIRLVTPTTSLVKPLLAGDFDFAITSLADELPERGLEHRELYKDKLVIIGRPDHPMTKLENPTLAQLREYSWILPNKGHYHRDRLERAFQAQDLPMPETTMECSASAFIKEMVLRSDLIGLVAGISVQPEERFGLISSIFLPLPFLMRPISIVWRANETQAPATARLMRIIFERAAEGGLGLGR